jgi:Na+-translocating ferredoxin:NAD+ oxidoreductase RnfG subunit
MRHQWLLPVAGGLALPLSGVAYAVEYATAESARQAAFPAATAFEPVLIAAAVKADIARESGRFAVSPQVWRVRADERPLGWFIVDEVIGKVELITYGVALDASGAIVSIDVLAYRESHGDAIKLPSWRNQFVGKGPADPVRIDVDIRNVSGATLSCRHVTEGVHRLLQIYERVLARS